jgi:hypothetical protein
MNARRPVLSDRAVRQLTIDPRPWLSCDDCFELVDQYLESLLAGAVGANTGLRAHLLGCGACCEEARGLITLLGADQQIPAEQALRLLDSDLARPRLC